MESKTYPEPDPDYVGTQTRIEINFEEYRRDLQSKKKAE